MTPSPWALAARHYEYDSVTFLNVVTVSIPVRGLHVNRIGQRGSYSQRATGKAYVFEHCIPVHGEALNTAAIKTCINK